MIILNIAMLMYALPIYVSVSCKILDGIVASLYYGDFI